MRLIKEVVARKYNDYFIHMKNNRFKPEIFYEAVSLANAYFIHYKKRALDENQVLARKILIKTIMWDCLVNSFKYSVLPENKTKLNEIVKSNYSKNSMPFINLLKQRMDQDEIMFNDIFSEFKSVQKRDVVEKSYDDIRSKFSIGVVRSR